MLAHTFLDYPCSPRSEIQSVRLRLIVCKAHKHLLPRQHGHGCRRAGRLVVPHAVHLRTVLLGQRLDAAQLPTLASLGLPYVQDRRLYAITQLHAAAWALN